MTVYTEECQAAILTHRNYSMCESAGGSRDRDGQKKVQVLPEGMGVVFLHPEKYGKNIFGLVDIGGLNCNCVMFQDNLPLIGSMFTNGLGGGSRRV